MIVTVAIIGITVVAVLLAKSGKFGTKVKDSVDKVDEKLQSATSQTFKKKSLKGEQIADEKSLTEETTTSPIFSSAKMENENLDPLDNLTTIETVDFATNIDASLGDPLF